MRIYIRVYARVGVCVIEHVYTRVFARLYRYVFPVSLLRRVGPSFLPARRQFSFHVPPTIQFIRRIIPRNAEGTKGCFRPSLVLFHLVVALLSDLLQLLFLHVSASTAAKSRWLDRRSETRSNRFCSSMALFSIVTSLPSSLKLDRHEILFRYCLILAKLIGLILESRSYTTRSMR